MAKALPLFVVDPQASLAANAPLMLHTRLEEMYRYASCIADPTLVKQLHNMRIAAKRLRYTLEIYAACFSGKEYPRLYDQVKSIQEQIGAIHDIDVRLPLVQEFLHKHAEARPEIRSGLEALIKGQQAERMKLYHQFTAYWNTLQTQGFKKRFLEMVIALEAPPKSKTEEPV